MSIRRLPLCDIEDFRARTAYYPPDASRSAVHASISSLEGTCNNFFNRDVDPGKAFDGNRFAALNYEIDLFAQGIFNHAPESAERTISLRHLEMARMIGNEILTRMAQDERRGDTRTSSMMVLDTLVGEYKGEMMRARMRANQAVALASPAAQAAFAAIIEKLKSVADA